MEIMDCEQLSEEIMSKFETGWFSENAKLIYDGRCNEYRLVPKDHGEVHYSHFHFTNGEIIIFRQTKEEAIAKQIEHNKNTWLRMSRSFKSKLEAGEISQKDYERKMIRLDEQFGQHGN